LFTIGYSLAQLWMSWGIKPAALIGHSIGEFVAATIAGVFTVEDALTIVANRSKLMQDCPGGAMLSVRLPEESDTSATERQGIHSGSKWSAAYVS
jgi:phthiocerol/phenolphthiocerol synthesis type-I polyketide synthase E